MYEYKTVRTVESNLSPEEQVIKIATEMDAEGWVLVSVTTTPFVNFGLSAFFRREKK